MQKKKRQFSYFSLSGSLGASGALYGLLGNDFLFILTDFLFYFSFNKITLPVFVFFFFSFSLTEKLVLGTEEKEAKRQRKTEEKSRRKPFLLFLFFSSLFLFFSFFPFFSLFFPSFFLFLFVFLSFLSSSFPPFLICTKVSPMLYFLKQNFLFFLYYL